MNQNTQTISDTLAFFDRAENLTPDQAARKRWQPAPHGRLTSIIKRIIAADEAQRVAMEKSGEIADRARRCHVESLRLSGHDLIESDRLRRENVAAVAEFQAHQATVTTAAREYREALHELETAERELRFFEGQLRTAAQLKSAIPEQEAAGWTGANGLKYELHQAENRIAQLSPGIEALLGRELVLDAPPEPAIVMA